MKVTISAQFEVKSVFDLMYRYYQLSIMFFHAHMDSDHYAAYSYVSTVLEDLDNDITRASGDTRVIHRAFNTSLGRLRESLLLDGDVIMPKNEMDKRESIYADAIRNIKCLYMTHYKPAASQA